MNSLIKLLPLILISASIDLVAVAAEPSLDFVERAQAIDAELARCESGNKAFAADVASSLDESMRWIENELVPVEILTDSANDRHTAITVRIRRELKRLPDSPDATAFKQRFAELVKAWESGEVSIKKSDRPLVHWIHHVRLPNAEYNPTERFELHTGQLNRPIMLVLTSQNHRNNPGKTEWRLEREDASHVQAVLLCSPNDAFNCDANVMVFHREFWTWGSFFDAAEMNRRFVVDELGQRADVILPVYESDEPVRLDPQDTTWTRAYVAGELNSLAADIQAHRNTMFAQSESELRFQGATAAFNGTAQTFVTFSEFNLYGPIEKTKLSTKSSLWSFTRINEDKAFVLNSSQLVTWKNDSDPKKSWGPATMPTQWETGNFLRSITYDSKRHRLLATDRTGKSLFAFDIGDSEWSLIRNNLRDGIGVIYDANKDAIVILCQRRVVGSNANEQKTWLTYLDSAGKQTSELPLECDQPLSTYLSRAANELTLTEKYLIAVQPPASNQRIPAEAIIRVFDLATGEKLYDHMMEPEKGVAKYTAIPRNIKPTRYAVYREQIEAIGEQINKISKQDAEAARKFDERLATTLSLAPKVDNVTGLVDGDRAVKNVLKKLEELSAELDKLL